MHTYSYRECIPSALSPTPYIRNLFPKREVDLSLFLAALCYQGYQLVQTKQLVVPTWPQKTEFISKLCGYSSIGSEDAFGYIIESPSSIYLVFRGTVALTDWTANLDARSIPYPYVPNSGFVHKGFNSIYESMRNTVLRKLAGLSSTKTLYITGHSLGGAIATLAALDIAVNSHFRQPIICTFAAPRVGNLQFTIAFNNTIDQSIRVINAQDHVPSVPPPEISGYTHVKGGVIIDVYAGTNPAANHSISTGYWPGLVTLSPEYAQVLCTQNPTGFCPDTLT